MIWCVLLSLFGSAFYRAGGYGPPFNTKFRDFGTPLCGIIILYLLHPIPALKTFLALFFTFGLSFASMTTYFKRRGEDALWYNWLFVGLAFSMAILPFAIVTGQWLAFGLRTAILAALVPLWSCLIGDDDWEEFGRGFLFCWSLILYV